MIRPHADIVQDAAADLAIGVGYGETETAQRVAACARIDDPQQAKALVLDELGIGRWRPRWTARRVVTPRADDAPEDRRVNAQLPSRSRWRQREDVVESGRAQAHGQRKIVEPLRCRCGSHDVAMHRVEPSRLL